MTLNIRPATLADLDALTQMLLADAATRQAVDPILWKLDTAPHEKIMTNLKVVMETETASLRQQWLLAEADRVVIGVAHSVLLPVPPIYAGKHGAPGLIMEDCYVHPNAPRGTKTALIKAAEADLVAAGARIMLGSSIADGPWEAAFMHQEYEPLTLYFAKSGLSRTDPSVMVRKAAEADIPDIVTASAVHRKILNDLHPQFWKPHEDADSRFGAWMARSLTLADRDMFVSQTDGVLRGYAISQPATPLHFPTPHDTSKIGIIDDFHHDSLEDPAIGGTGVDHALALLEAAEAARAQRENTAVLVVCPAAWASKIKLLTDAGYRNAVTWYFKKVG